ncbi:MAG: deoxyribonuclease V [Chloroflexota bacterium]
MRVARLHEWQLSPAEARKLQSLLAPRVITRSLHGDPSLVAGTDISRPGADGLARAAVVVLSVPELKVVELRVVEERPTFPYVPGLLSFREAPLVLAACEKLESVPDLMLVDGHGIAHPRRFGLASHLGLFLDLPTIGCAKSVLCGEHGPLGEQLGDYSYLMDGPEVIGAALRTRRGVRPVYVSVGHRVDLPFALDWALSCCSGYRVPEPTRLAHLAAGGRLGPSHWKDSHPA